MDDTSSLPNLARFLSSIAQALSSKNIQLFINILGISSSNDTDPTRTALVQELASTRHPSRIPEVVRELLPPPDDAVNRMASWTSFMTPYFEFLKTKHASRRGHVSSLETTSKIHEALAKMLEAYSVLFPSWQVPLLKCLVSSFIVAASQADQERIANHLSPIKQQDSIRTLQTFISPMVMDPRDFPSSRKTGLLIITNAAFKIFFRLHSFNLMAAFYDNLTGRGELELHKYTQSQQVTYLYYLSRWFMMEHKWRRAEDGLAKAWEICASRFTKHKSKLLFYLTVCRMVLGKSLPSSLLLQSYNLSILVPLTEWYKQGQIGKYLSYLHQHQDMFRKYRVFIALRDRTHNVLFRRLLKRVHALISAENAASRSTVVKADAVLAALELVWKECQNDLVVNETLPGGQVRQQVCGTMGNMDLEDVLESVMALSEQHYIRCYVAPTSKSIVFSNLKPFPDLISEVHKMQDADRPSNWNERGAWDAVEED